MRTEVGRLTAMNNLHERKLMRAPKKMDVGQKMRHEMIMKEIQEEYESDTNLHLQARQKAEGIRSSQISALVAYLIKKSVI